jgi:tetratricopeptide (TPR) repeat protein
MDSLVTAAARALKAGDPLGALKRIALRDDAPALALRGIAMAQLGELAKAKVLLRRAARSFGPRERVERARCVTAEAEVALASRDLQWPTHALDEARRTFGALGDHDNRLHAALLQIRRLLLLGRVTEAGDALDKLDLRAAPAMLTARGELVAFEIALRRGHTAPARAALARARAAADRSGIDPLCAEVERAERTLALPAARLIAGGEERPLVLAEVETVLASQHLIVDACRRAARWEQREVRLARRPVLFALLRSLAEAWPGEATREILCERAFRARRLNESHRARLRVEVGRLRKELRQQLARSPRRLVFRGLRGCVKQLAGARRWSARCEKLQEQIIEYLRQCLTAESVEAERVSAKPTLVVAARLGRKWNVRGSVAA